MRWPSRRWLLVPVTSGCVAWATVSVLAVFTDSPAVGANSFTTGTWGCSSPGSTTYVATADAWIDEAAPTTSNGGTNPLNVQTRNGARNRRALVKFPLPASVPAGCSVTAATLRLYANSSVASRTIDVYRAAAAWTEAVTWNTRPGTTGTAVGSGSLGATGWQQWTVTAQVAAQFPAANNNGFVVRDGTESQSSTAQQQVYRSREATGTPNNRPELVVTFG